MRTNFFKSSPSPPMSPLNSQPHHTLSDTMMDENFEAAELLISKWDATPDHNSSYCDTTSLFSPEYRQEGKQYLSSIKQLQSVMQYFIHDPSTSDKLIHAQRLTQTAMKRLEKEFYQILKSNRQNLDAESVSTHSSSRASRSSEVDFYDSDDEPSRAAAASAADVSVSVLERVSLNAMGDLKAIADCMIGAGYAKETMKTIPPMDGDSLSC